MSHDSQYALINHSPDVRNALLVVSLIWFAEEKAMLTGNPSMGPQSWPTSTQVYWATPGTSCDSELLRRRRWKLHREWKRRYVLLYRHHRYLLLTISSGGSLGAFFFGTDGNVYIWHRETETLLEVLPGHGEGSVNSVAWNPKNERMFASCSDDNTIRIWEAPPPTSGSPASTMTNITDHHPIQNGKGKGKTRQQWDGDGADFVSGSSGAPRL